MIYKVILTYKSRRDIKRSVLENENNLKLSLNWKGIETIGVNVNGRTARLLENRINYQSEVDLQQNAWLVVMLTPAPIPSARYWKKAVYNGKATNHCKTNNEEKNVSPYKCSKVCTLWYYVKRSGPV